MSLESKEQLVSTWVTVVLTLFLGACSGPQPSPPVAPTDTLPSWRAGDTKEKIVEFIRVVTDEGDARYVPPPERIAVFDNDGTLWCEQPIYFQLQFAIDRVRDMAPGNPDWMEKPAFRAIIEGNTDELQNVTEKDLVELLMVSHSGITVDEFAGYVRDWISTAKHPRYDVLYKELAYQPMLELLDTLRVNGFKTFIVSGGGIEFMRVFAEQVYGIPPEQIVGSSIKTEFRITDGLPVLFQLAELNFINDKEGKPVGIHQFIGRRPIAAFGNSDGDLQMLQYTAAGGGARLMFLLHHDDAEREYAYDRESHIGRLDKALDQAREKGWVVASMKDDFETMFPKPSK